jgi:hypothetical protein
MLQQGIQLAHVIFEAHVPSTGREQFQLRSEPTASCGKIAEA